MKRQFRKKMVGLVAVSTTHNPIIGRRIVVLLIVEASVPLTIVESPGNEQLEIIREAFAVGHPAFVRIIVPYLGREFGAIDILAVLHHYVDDTEKGVGPVQGR